jgi:hypothetical protein
VIGQAYYIPDVIFILLLYKEASFLLVRSVIALSKLVTSSELFLGPDDVDSEDTDALRYSEWVQGRLVSILNEVCRDDG